jgi:Putative transposase of IS4/5 family (DUF4096)
MAHGRYDLTEFEWRTIQPLLPNKPRRVPRVDDRRVLTGIFHHLRSGSAHQSHVPFSWFTSCADVTIHGESGPLSY